VLAATALTACSNGDVESTSPETLAQTQQGLTCVTLGGAVATDDAVLAVDPTDPTKAAANFGTSQLFNVGTTGTTVRQALLRFNLATIPATATITSAMLQLTKAASLGSGPMTFHRATAPWVETSVTYSSFAGAFDSTVLASVDPSTSGGVLSLDFTTQVAAWVNGLQPNHGFLLAEPTNGRISLGASEAPAAASRPALTVCYAPSTCSNGLQDGVETGVDCGGPCAPCVNPCASVTCVPSDACHLAGVCNPSNGICSNPVAPWGTACDDGNACTATDACQSGVCVGSSPTTCVASDACHLAGSCDPASGVCSNPPVANGTGCDDGNACSSGDTCQAGLCQPGADICNSGATSFTVLAAANVNAYGIDHLVLKVALASNDAAGPTWCDDYQDLCAGFGLVPSGCGQPFSSMQNGYGACTTQWASNGTVDSLGCNASGGVSSLAQQAGFSDAASDNSFAFHYCDSGTCQKTMCSGSYCNTALSYFDTTKPHGYTVCIAPPSCSDGHQNQGEIGVDCGGPCAQDCCGDGIENDQETGLDCGGPVCAACQPMCQSGAQDSDEDYLDCGGSFCPPCGTGFSVLSTTPVNYNGIDHLVLEVKINSPTATGATWCDDYQDLCGSYGLVPTGCGDPFASMANGYGACASQWGSDGVSDSLGCNPSGGVYQAAQQAGYASATSDNSFGFHYCDSGTCQKTLCSGAYCNTSLSYIDTTKFKGFTLCKQPPTCFDGVKNQSEIGLDCGGPCAQDCCGDGVQNDQETGLDCGGPVCGACQPMCSDGLLNSDEDFPDCGGSFCPACPTGFQVLATQNVAYNGNNYLVLKVKLGSDQATGPTWCDDYTDLCQAYGLSPTGCGQPFAGMSNGYGACVSQWGSVGGSDTLGCNASGSVASIAQTAGFSDASSDNSFAYHSCDSGTCQKTMCSGSYCNTALSYIDVTKPHGYTVCR
jgi:hypothetical protein